MRRDPRYKAAYSLEENIEFLKRADLAIGQRKRRELKAGRRRERKRREELGREKEEVQGGEGVKEEERKEKGG